MNDEPHAAIQKAVADGVTTAMSAVAGEFSEAINGLATHMDERFEQVNERMDQFGTRMDRFELRMDGFENRFDRLEGRLENLEDSTREGFDRVNITLDGIVARLDDDEVERAALTAQMDRHEDWIIEAAPLVRVDYTPGS